MMDILIILDMLLINIITFISERVLKVLVAKCAHIRIMAGKQIRGTFEANDVEADRGTQLGVSPKSKCLTRIGVRLPIGFNCRKNVINLLTRSRFLFQLIGIPEV